MRVYTVNKTVMKYMKELGREYEHKLDGEGDRHKKYWMVAGDNMFPDSQSYIFGNKNNTYKLQRTESPSRGVIEWIADMVLEAAGIQVPPEFGPFTVICRYSQGQGVGWHRDNDYWSDVDVIISMTIVGTAVFSIELEHETTDIKLQEGNIIVFDRSIKHSAGPSQTHTRVNVTTRYARKGASGVFKRRG